MNSTLRVSPPRSCKSSLGPVKAFVASLVPSGAKIHKHRGDGPEVKEWLPIRDYTIGGIRFGSGHIQSDGTVIFKESRLGRNEMAKAAKAKERATSEERGETQSRDGSSRGKGCNSNGGGGASAGKACRSSTSRRYAPRCNDNEDGSVISEGVSAMICSEIPRLRLPCMIKY